MINYELKNYIDRVIELGKSMDINVFGVRNISKTNTEQEIRNNFLEYLLIISSYGNMITSKEVEFINNYLGFNFTYSELEYIFVNNKSYYVNLSKNLPEIFKTVEIVDDILNRQDNSEDVSYACQIIYMAYEYIGGFYISCDDIIDSRKSNGYNSYLKMIKEYTDKQVEKYTKKESKNNNCNKSVCDNSSKSILTKGYEINTNNPELSDLLKELDDLIGLNSVKEDVKSLINLLKVRKLREEKGMSQPEMSLHLVFSGNPGTGKTTVARLLAKIYYRLGLLSKGSFVEVDRSKLVGGFVGQTALKTQEVIDSAIGGILFIDEAYSLTNNKGYNDYGSEVIDTLVKAMEDNRNNLIVIVAGYPDLMEDFLASNPGLRSRFNKFIYFQDYSSEELVDIFKKMCDSYSLNISSDASKYISEYFTKRCLSKGKDFANAREVRNFFEKSLVIQANRLMNNSGLSKSELSQITKEDVSKIVL